MVIEEPSEYEGRIFQLKWTDVDTFDDLDPQLCTQTYGVCFVDDKIVIGKNKKGTWSLIGGKIEPGETIEQALVREVQEESNMKVLKHRPLGNQQVTNPEGKIYYQLRSVCIVEPYGEFVEDPAESVVEIKLIDPKEYKQYFDWGKIGERIIQRAIELKPTLENS